MKNFKKLTKGDTIKKISIVVFLLTFGSRSHAFLGDGGAGWAQIPYLIKILEENYKRYKQLQIMIKSAQNQEEFLKSLSSGLDNSIGILESLPVKDEGLLNDLKNFKKSYDSVLDLYGTIPQKIGRAHV